MSDDGMVLINMGPVCQLLDKRSGIAAPLEAGPWQIKLKADGRAIIQQGDVKKWARNVMPGLVHVTDGDERKYISFRDGRPSVWLDDLESHKNFKYHHVQPHDYLDRGRVSVYEFAGSIAGQRIFWKVRDFQEHLYTNTFHTNDHRFILYDRLLM